MNNKSDILSLFKAILIGWLLLTAFLIAKPSFAYTEIKEKWITVVGISELDIPADVIPIFVDAK